MKVNISNIDLINKGNTVSSTRIVNKALNSILKNIDNNNVKNFYKENDWYVVIYKNDQVWKFRNFGLLDFIDNELNILLNRDYSKNCVEKHELF